MTLSTVKHFRTPVPVLLNEFPVPPTFIPQCVPTATNPPPSRPPSLPLPPIPGPSPLSEHDLFQLSAAARSRRASRISTSSTSSSWRGSVASVGSAGSRPPSLNFPVSTALASQPSVRTRTESATSTSALSIRSQNGSLSSKTTARAANPDNHRPTPISVNPAILEADESLAVDAADPSLTCTSLSDLPYATPSPHPHVTDKPTVHGERLSSIDMRDLPTLQDDDTADLDDDAHSFYQQMHATRSKGPTQKSRLRQAASQSQLNGKPTGDKAHRRTTSATQHDRSRKPSHHAFPEKSLPDEFDRASSPDVASIIAATPRPRRRSETSSAGSRSGSRSRRRAHKSLPKSLPGSRRVSAVGRLSVFSLPDEAARQGSTSLASRSLLTNTHDVDELWNDDGLAEDYGVVIGGGDGDFATVPAEDAAGESDSSLDLHTPLPSLMLRDGLLSPHSKLLPQNIHSETPVVATPTTDGNNRNGSTKSGVFKDERDTIRRRVRHRDGRLLRGGIGLTTGLGWSDSEDEDAPSPLTKRLSNLALSRQSSAASLKTLSRTPHSQPHPLSRSSSGDAKVYSSKSHQNLRRPSAPPTSWQSSTLSLSIPEQDPLDHPPAPSRFSDPPSSRVDIQTDSQRNDQVRTPSSSSTQSLPGPPTPDVTDVPLHSASLKSWDRDKNLPPLPLSRGPSIAGPRPVGSLSEMKNRPPKLDTLPLRRPISSESELSDPPVMSPHTPKLPYTPTHGSARTTPRPLQLSASLGSGLQPGEPASMQGLLLGYNRQLHDQQRARTSSGPSAAASSGQRFGVRPLVPVVSPRMSRSGSADLSLTDLGEARLRPRTGTGMVYKKSPTSLTRAAADVQAQSRIRLTSERTGQVVA